MPFASTKRDVAKSIKTLLVMVQSMRGQQVTITLRNDSIVRGTVIKVDANMNIELGDALIELDPFYVTVAQPSSLTNVENATSRLDDEVEDSEIALRDKQVITDGPVNGSSDDKSEPSSTETLPYFLVKGSRIRHIDLPNDFEPVAQAKQEIGRLRNRTRVWTKRDIVR